MEYTLSNNLKQKQNLNLSLKLWLPILQSSLSDLEKQINTFSYENPFVELKRPKEYFNNFAPSGTSGEFVESLALYSESLYDKIEDQIAAPYFPTPNSQNVAHEILCDINEEGYFEGDIEEIAKTCNVYKEYVESIRKRFASCIEPCGIGSLDIEESFLFQLDNVDRKIDDELFAFSQKVIKDINHLDKYSTHHRFDEVKNIIKKFKNPPAVDYMTTSAQVIPDFIVNVEDDIEVKINHAQYPDIIVKEPFSSKNDEVKNKLKEARDLVNLLNLRKSTLYKIVLLLVEKQISYFVGGELKPLSMQEVAEELGFAESTISRAVANKYIECSLGILPLKFFFTNALSSKGLSSSEVKSFIQSLVENESKDEPLTDQDILEKIEERFNLQMVRRTITKYRKILDIPSSKDRKKIYKVEMSN